MIFYKRIVVSIVTLLTVSFFSIGSGCDIDFSTNDNGGQGVSDTESVSGQVIDIIPDIGIEGITVEIVNDENVKSEGVTDMSGDFTVNGDFDNNPGVVKFLDSANVSLGSFSVNVFPGAEVDLGDLFIESDGTVTLENDAMVIFSGDIVEINCTGNDGSIDVEVNNIDVTVNIDSSTDIERESDNQNITCDDLLIGKEVRVDGDLPNPTGNIVDASDIEVQN